MPSVLRFRGGTATCTRRGAGAVGVGITIPIKPFAEPVEGRRVSRSRNQGVPRCFAPAGRRGGVEIDATGDGFLSCFDGPARAIRCAEALVRRLAELGIEIRAGLHTGECERANSRVAGLAVHIGARIAAQAGPGEVLVSRTVRDLVVGSGLSFASRGDFELKGVPGEWELYALEPMRLVLPV